MILHTTLPTFNNQRVHKAFDLAQNNLPHSHFFTFFYFFSPSRPGNALGIYVSPPVPPQQPSMCSIISAFASSCGHLGNVHVIMIDHQRHTCRPTSILLNQPSHRPIELARNARDNATKSRLPQVTSHRDNQQRLDPNMAVPRYVSHYTPSYMPSS